MKGRDKKKQRELIRQLKSFMGSFKNAFAGIRAVILSERNFRVHICMMLYVLAFSVIGEVGMAAASRFVLCFGLVMGFELINSAIERLCDVTKESYDRRIKVIKDMSAGAVLVSAAAAATVGLMVFLSPVVFGKVMSRLFEMPLLSAGLILSLPLSIWFIVGMKKK